MDIPVVSELPFQLVTELGEGRGGAVYSLAPLDVDLSDLREEGLNQTPSEESYSDTDSFQSGYGTESDEEGKFSDTEEGESLPTPPDLEAKGEEDEDACDPYSGSENSETDDEDPFDRVSIASVDEQRLHGECATGRVQIVTKVVTELEELVYWVVADHTNREDPVMISVHPDKAEAFHWRRKRQLDPNVFKVSKANSYIDDERVMTDFFRTEAFINHKLTQLADQGLTPHILSSFGTFILEDDEGQQGHIQLERCNGTLFDILNDEEYEDDCGVRLENEDVAALFFQTLFGLGVLQEKAQLKHHDFHTSNVFVQRITSATVFRGQPLDTATHFHYHVEGQDYYVPNCGVLVKIGDFGFSSVVHEGKTHYRIDMECYNDDPQTFGHWHPSLEGNHGYDAMMLMCETPFIDDNETQSRFRNTSALVNFSKKLRKIIFGKNGRVSRAEKRPTPGHVSDKTPYQVIRGMYAVNPDEWYEFRQYPEPKYGTPNIVTLGSTEW